MRFTVHALTDVGRVREGNEDSYLVPTSGEPRLIAVADGMGGHEGGEVASSLALEVLQSWESRLADRGASALKEAVLDANQIVWSKGKTDPKLDRMGTTLTAAWLSGDRANIAHVGDSRAYLLRGNNLEQLTTDQTVVQQLVDDGTISAEEATTHPRRNFLLQSVGSEPTITVDTLSVDLHVGDRLLLVSDGLYGPVPPPQIREILLQNDDPSTACRALIDAANAGGGHDNITVVMLVAEGDADEIAAAPDTGGQVIIERPSVASPKSRGLSKATGRLIAVGVALIAAAVVVVLLLNTVRTASTKYLVASAPSGNVVILKGTPGTNGKPPMGDVVETTDVQVASLPATYQKDLRAGIPVNTLEEAKRVVASIPRVLGPQDTPSPIPVTPSPPPLGTGPTAP